MACVEYNGGIFCQGSTPASNEIFSIVRKILPIKERLESDVVALSRLQKMLGTIDRMKEIAEKECSPIPDEFSAEQKKEMQDAVRMLNFKIETSRYKINELSCAANKEGANLACNPNMAKPNNPFSAPPPERESGSQNLSGKKGKSTPKGNRGKDGGSKEKCKK